MNLTTEQIEQIVKGAPVDDWTHYCTRNRQYFKRDGNTNMLLVWRSRTEAWSIPLVGKPRWLERREQLEEILALRQRVQELEAQLGKTNNKCVVYDLEPAQHESAISDHLIKLRWTPPKGESHEQL